MPNEASATKRSSSTTAHDTEGQRPGQERERSDIARRAYEIYCERGCEDGHETEDWLQAERELRGKSS
jgi:hypothetical protein